jgi:GlpG protein
MRVIETSLDEDLKLFSSYLWQKRVIHRIFEERGAQVVELADPTLAEAVRQDYQAWRSGRLMLEAQPRPGAVPAAGPQAGWLRAIARYPGLAVLIALALLVFPFSYPVADGRIGTVVAWLTIVDLHSSMAALPSLPQLLAQGEVWRWFTPMFLHFSVLHLGFNCAINIELGRRVERTLGGGGLWLLVLALAGVSNLAQYAFGGGPLFGGLSGVGYGLLGFILVMSRRHPGAAAWQLPPGLSGGLLVFLVVFSTGITEPFGLFVANAAHWGGVLTGAALAALWPRPADA